MLLYQRFVRLEVGSKLVGSGVRLRNCRSEDLCGLSVSPFLVWSIGIGRFEKSMALFKPLQPLLTHLLFAP